jgi:hypothetical protein
MQTRCSASRLCRGYSTTHIRRVVFEQGIECLAKDLYHLDRKSSGSRAVGIARAHANHGGNGERR